MNARRAAFLAAALAGGCLDIAAKSLVFSHFKPGTTTTLVPHLLWIQLTTNPGIAWGLFPSRVWAWVSVLAIPLIASYFLWSKKTSRLETVCGSLILAGTIGNSWDRVLLGKVRDFLLIPLIPNFNLADAMLTCSISVLFVYWIFHDRRPVGEARPADPGQPHDGGVGDVGRDHGPRP